MKNYWYRSVIALVQAARVARGAKFLYVPHYLSFSNLCLAFYYEQVDPSKADQIFISQILRELADWGLVTKRCVTRHQYRLENVIFHDIYLRTTDGQVFCRGTSVDFSEACAKAIGEVLERTSLKYNVEDRVITGSLSDIAKKKTPHLSPRSFAQATELQKTTFPNFVLNDTDILSWVPADNLLTKMETMVPAQTVFYNNYINYPNEKVVLLQSTHGAGGGYTERAAVRSALFEVIHRHFFLSDWYAGVAPEKIDISTIPNRTAIFRVIQDLEVNGFIVNLLDYSKKANLPTVVCVLERYGGWYMGAATSTSVETAIERAVSEAVSTYLWQVQNTTLGNNQITQKRIAAVRHDFTDTENTDAFNRIMLYSSSYFVQQLPFCREFLSGQSKAYAPAFDVSEDFDFTAYVTKTFGDVYIYRVEKSVLMAFDYHAVRAIVPKSFPFALQETYSRPLLAGREPVNPQITPFP